MLPINIGVLGGHGGTDWKTQSGEKGHPEHGKKIKSMFLPESTLA